MGGAHSRAENDKYSMMGGGTHSRAGNENMPAIGSELEKVVRKPRRVKKCLVWSLIIKIGIFVLFSMDLQKYHVCRIL